MKSFEDRIGKIVTEEIGKLAKNKAIIITLPRTVKWGDYKK